VIIYVGGSQAVSSNVVWLLHFDGSNGSSSFEDSSVYQWAVTAHNSAVISTAGPKFGTGALDGDGSKYVSIADNDIFDFGTGDYSLAFWYYRAGNWPASGGEIAGWSTSGGTEFRLYDGTTFNDLGFALHGVITGSTSVAMTPNAYTWICITRSSGRVCMWQNTTLVVNSTNNPTASATPVSALRFGSSDTRTANLASGCRLDECVGVKGVAWFTNTNPPTSVPTAPYINTGDGRP
jgi:hypothetical protein